jgi:nucleotide-binding universal stress UspA family protein
MFNNVLVGVDGLDGGRDAIALAANLIATGGELTLAYVYHGAAYVWRGSDPSHDAAEREHGFDVLRAARREAGIGAALRCHRSPSVGHGLHDLAETSEADLLVVGSSRRSLSGRVLLDDDTRNALNGAPCAVAVAPAGYAQDRHLMAEIGIGFDGSPESEYALEIARELATEHGTRLSAFEAVCMPAVALSAGPVGIDDWMDGLLEDARNRVAALDGVEPHTVFGQPAEELALFSASVDLLVVGSRSYGPVGRLVHGSTSLQLARRARCPLLVLTRTTRGPDSSGSQTDRTAAVAAG